MKRKTDTEVLVWAIAILTIFIALGVLIAMD